MTEYAALVRTATPDIGHDAVRHSRFVAVARGPLDAVLDGIQDASRVAKALGIRNDISWDRWNGRRDTMASTYYGPDDAYLELMLVRLTSQGKRAASLLDADDLKTVRDYLHLDGLGSDARLANRSRRRVRRVRRTRRP